MWPRRSVIKDALITGQVAGEVTGQVAGEVTGQVAGEVTGQVAGEVTAAVASRDLAVVVPASGPKAASQAPQLQDRGRWGRTGR
jgi:hypothetical protein